jgi:hypothetical protein
MCTLLAKDTVRVDGGGEIGPFFELATAEIVELEQDRSLSREIASVIASGGMLVLVWYGG